MSEWARARFTTSTNLSGMGCAARTAASAWRSRSISSAACGAVAPLPTGSECRHHLLAKAAHRGEVLVVAHVAQAGLAQQVLHAGIAQLGDLVTHSRRRPIKRAGG